SALNDVANLLNNVEVLVNSWQLDFDTWQTETDEKLQNIQSGLSCVSLSIENENIINAILSNTESIMIALNSMTSGGLTSEQEDVINQTYENTVSLLNCIGLTENSSTILTQLNNIAMNTESIMEKLDLPSNQYQESEPYDPPPDIIYKTRDVYYSEFNYDISTPQDLFEEYFTINDNVNAMCKVEFDITAETDIGDVVFKLHLSDIEVLIEETINIEAGTKHYCFYGIFMTERTDYYLMMTFVNGTTKLFTVNNIVYEVVGDNANFLSYRHKNFAYTVNFDYYLFKVRGGKVSYIKTSALEPDLGQDYTQIVDDDNYCYLPAIISTINGATATTSVDLGGRLIRMDKKLKKTTQINLEGKYLSIAEHTNSNGSRVMSYGNFNTSSNPGYAYRYNTKTKKFYSNYYQTNGTIIVDSTGKDLSTHDTYVSISCFHSELSYKQYYTDYRFIIFTSKKGNNYLTIATNPKMESSLGYGTRVKFGEIPNYQGSVTTSRTVKVLRIFMYVYDHWKVYYVSMQSGKMTSLGVKTISGEYDELLPGFNGDYFAVKNGEMILLTDNDVVKETFSS
ncbi:MAG: hypothetical protein ACI4TX_01070, partial [Christensenellales bacterium]